ncbi:uncharacterized protein LOC102706064 [Oryza brachyantha]|uniref:uncharacterized protein LOC102706064 n=1 Tax=Oryza brachyantha TaxID=4533 RepID=UPI001AD97F96|nr:uncharacterized protein LOC102706064 [Oryza brachyantha]
MASPPCPSADYEARALALEQCERELDAVVQSMLNLNLVDSGDDDVGDATAAADMDGSIHQNQQLAAAGGAGAEDRACWVQAMVSEMLSATSMDDARERCLRVLDAYGSAVVEDSSRAGAAASAQIALLRKAVLFHHRLRVAQEAEKTKLRLEVDGYREKVRQLEATNYALSLHLRLADLHRGGGGMPPGPGNPEIF